MLIETKRIKRGRLREGTVIANSLSNSQIRITIPKKYAQQINIEDGSLLDFGYDSFSKKLTIRNVGKI